MFIQLKRLGAPGAIFFYAFSLLTLMYGLAVPVRLFSETGSTVPGNGKIQRIEVSGLRRTQNSVVQALLRSYRGEPASTFDPNAVAARLLETGIFEDIQVELRPDLGNGDYTLAVSVREKWTIIPVPIFAASSDGITAGAALIDANALGLNHKLFLLGLWIPDGWLSGLAYSTGSESSKKIGFSTSLFYSRQERKLVDPEDRDLRRFSADDFSTEAGMGIPLTGPLRLTVALGFHDLSVTETIFNPTDSLPQAESGRYLNLKAGLSARSSRWDGVFLSENTVSLRYTYHLLGQLYQDVSLGFQAQIASLPGLRFSLRGTQLYGFDVPLALESPVAEAGISILPSNYRAAIVSAGSLNAEARLFSLRWGVISALLGYQGALTQGLLTPWRWDQGPTAGLRLYVARLAIPAVDMGAAYNLSTGLFRATFGVGMRM